jgi:hypothetical protein
MGILFVFTCSIAYKVLMRKRQRLNLIFSGFFISLSIGLFLNMVYAAMTNGITILILNFLTNYFIFFGPVFLLIVNMLILESPLIYSVKKQNKYIIYYGILLFVGMLIFVLLGEVFDTPNVPFLGVQIINNAPKWGFIFFAYIVLIMTIFIFIPINYTNYKIYSRFETKELKRKWFFYLFGFLGLTVVLYLGSIFNLLDANIYAGVRSIISFSLVTLIIWGYMMYYGIGIELKKE